MAGYRRPQSSHLLHRCVQQTLKPGQEVGEGLAEDKQDSHRAHQKDKFTVLPAAAEDKEEEGTSEDHNQHFHWQQPLARVPGTTRVVSGPDTIQ